MGGNAFPHLKLVRVQRDHVWDTVEHVVRTLAFKGFSLDYALDNLMGSAGKQDSSGDLDFALNSVAPRFIGEHHKPVFDLRALNTRMRAVLPEAQVYSKGLPGGQLNSAWPIAGNPALGLVQVDFILGDPEWLKFTHWSPGKDVSPWKGVMRSTLLGVLAKRLKEFELHNEDGLRVARVGLHFDLEKGLYRRWELQLRPGNGLSTVSPDLFETRVPTVPRFERFGYLKNPETVLGVLLGAPTAQSEVDTFEKLVAKTKQLVGDDYPDMVERFLAAFRRSAGANDYSLEEVRHAMLTSF